MAGGIRNFSGAPQAWRAGEAKPGSAGTLKHLSPLKRGRNVNVSRLSLASGFDLLIREKISVSCRSFHFAAASNNILLIIMIIIIIIIISFILLFR